MCEILKEVGQLCEAILIFQRHIQKIKQELFMIPECTDVLIWNHLIGKQYDAVNPSSIKKICNMYKVNYNEQSIGLLFYQHSSLKKQTLTRKQFLSLFINFQTKFIEEILKSRNHKNSFSKNHTPHYKVTEILVKILERTFHFLEVKEEMKQNIYKKKKELNFEILKADAQHFLVFLSQFNQNWLIEDAKIVFNHIIKRKEPNLKQFYYFFIPFSCKSKKLNPDDKSLKHSASFEFKQTFSSLIEHKKASHFGKKSLKSKKVLYLK